MSGNADILLTGGTGRLGSELTHLLPGIVAPPRSELDITEPGAVAAVLNRYHPTMLVHAAAYTDVAGAERERAACWQANVTGTRNLAHAALSHGIFLVHISTDYVFSGTTGMYREDDLVGPVQTHYALTKLVAEEVARVVPDHLVVRTSFRPREWPYPVAFHDVFTSQDYVDVIAPKIALAIRHARQVPFQTLHIATERKSVYELAKRRNPDVLAGSKRDATVEFPDDVSLDVSRWSRLESQWVGVD